MDNKVCSLFGHANTSYHTELAIEMIAERQCQEYSVRTCVVGNRGDFDGYAAMAI